MAYGREDRAPRKISGTVRDGAGMGFQSDLARLNAVDRATVEAGTAFGKKHGLDTARGIEFGDLRRFNRIDPDVILGAHPGGVTDAERLAALRKVSNIQSLYGKPVGITEAQAPRKSQKSQHVVGNAFDLRVPTQDRARIAYLAAQQGFGGIGASYDATQPQMVHVDTGPRRQWGQSRRFASATPWQKRAIARGYASGEPSQEQWDMAAANQPSGPFDPATVPVRPDVAVAGGGGDVPPGQQPTSGGQPDYGSGDANRRQISPEYAQGPMAAVEKSEEEKDNAYWRNMIAGMNFNIPQLQAQAPVSGIIEPPQVPQAAPLQQLGIMGGPQVAQAAPQVDPEAQRRQALAALLEQLNAPTRA